MSANEGSTIKEGTMMSEKNWYAIYTKPRCEKKVAELLSSKNIENFFAINRTGKPWIDRRKAVLEPVFGSYVFVFITVAEFSIVKQTDGVLNFLYWLGGPAAIAEKEIEAIRLLSGEIEAIAFSQLEIYPIPRLRETDRPFLTWAGDIKEASGRHAEIHLPTLGFHINAEVTIVRTEVVKFIKPTGEVVGQEIFPPVETSTGS